MKTNDLGLPNGDRIPSTSGLGGYRGAVPLTTQGWEGHVGVW